jgi:hypothetical protein
MRIDREIAYISAAESEPSGAEVSKARGPTRRACSKVRARRVEGGRSPTTTRAGPHF